MASTSAPASASKQAALVFLEQLKSTAAIGTTTTKPTALAAGHAPAASSVVGGAAASKSKNWVPEYDPANMPKRWGQVGEEDDTDSFYARRYAAESWNAHSHEARKRVAKDVERQAREWAASRPKTWVTVVGPGSGRPQDAYHWKPTFPESIVGV